MRRHLPKELRAQLAQFWGYWESYSFGDLSEVAKTRKQALERLVPRLKIGRVSELKGNFLVVKGHRPTYKIHLGSGNILLELNDQYLPPNAATGVSPLLARRRPGSL